METALSRNQGRDNRVPDKVIEEMIHKMEGPLKKDHCFSLIDETVSLESIVNAIDNSQIPKELTEMSPSEQHNFVDKLDQIMRKCLSTFLKDASPRVKSFGKQLNQSRVHFIKQLKDSMASQSTDKLLDQLIEQFQDSEVSEDEVIQKLGDMWMSEVKCDLRFI